MNKFDFIDFFDSLEKQIGQLWWLAYSNKKMDSSTNWIRDISSLQRSPINVKEASNV
jgi:hypothetical protein